MAPQDRGPGTRSFRILRFRPDVKTELEAELDFHFTETVENLVERGWSEENAHAEARRRFGDVGSYRRNLERIGRMRVRRRRTVDFWDVVRHNFAWALRGLRRQPAFSAAVILTLSLGIGANATMFGVVDRLLLTPPQHIADADRVRKLHIERFGRDGEPFMSRIMTYPDYLDIGDLTSLESVAAYSGRRQWTLGEGAEARRVSVQMATASLFPTLGVSPVIGRFYDETEDAFGVPLTAVVSEEFWEREFGRDPSILGRKLDLGSGQFEVVGVTPAGFTGAELAAVDVWVPLRPAQMLRAGEDWVDARGWWWLRSVVRVADGATFETADSQLTTAHRAARRSWQDAEPSEYRTSYFAYGEPRLFTGSVISSRGPDPSSTSIITVWLAGVSLIVLLIACANVANLLLTRGVRARREHAVRVALGVDPGRLMAQLLTEALVLSACGAAAALLVARWSSGVVHAALIPNVAFTDTHMTIRLLVFIGVATGLTAVLAGVLPALQASRTAAAEALRAASRGNSSARSKLRGALMVGQTTLSVVLLVGAGLFVRSLWGASRVDTGFDVEHGLMVQIDLTGDGDPGREAQVYEDAVARVAALPTVRAAALSTGTMPLWGALGVYLRVPGLDSLPALPGGGPYAYRGTVGLLEAFGTRVTRGRDFLPSEFGEGAEPVMMVSERTVREVWPNQDPLTQCARLNREDREGEAPEPCRRVVGVFDEMMRFDLDEDPALAFAVPESSDEPEYWGMIVSANGNASALMGEIRQAVLGAAADVRFVDIQPFSDLHENILGPWTLGASMFTAFGVLALILAALGLYSVLAFSVAQRHRELGIRAALGATGQDLIGMVMSQAGRFVLAGLLLGLGLALGLGRFVQDLLFEVQATDVTVYGVVTLTLLVAGTLASFIPAWRATSVAPTAAIDAD